MKHSLSLIITVLTFLVMGCSSSITVNHDFDSSANFAALKSFDWLPVPPAAGGSVRAEMERNSLLDKRVKAAVNSQLVTKGYIMDNVNPDFLLSYHTGVEDKISVTDWGYNYARPYWGTSHVDVYQYKQGTLVLDVIEATSKNLIWRGVAQGTLQERATPEEREEKLGQAVTKLLDNFPPTK